MNLNVLSFILRNISWEEVNNRRILEVGSQNVNGSSRSAFLLCKPKEYIGIDMQEGPGVDLVCNSEELVKRFGKDAFDLVVSTEMLEHVLDWRKVILNLKQVLQEEGLLILTTRSKGFQYHAYPYDFWRYEIDDFKEIFADMDIMSIERDYPEPGVFIKAKKPKNFQEKDLTQHKLYSIVLDRPITRLEKSDIESAEYTGNLKKMRLRKALRGNKKKVWGNLKKIIAGDYDNLRMD